MRPRLLWLLALCGPRTRAACAPELALEAPTRPVAVLRGGFASLRGVRVASARGDELGWGPLAGDRGEALVAVDVRADAGGLELAPGYRDVPGEGSYGGPTPHMHLQGFRSTVNIALHGLRYRSDADGALEETAVHIAARIIDDGGDGECGTASGIPSMTATVSVQVREKPFDPVVTLNGRPMGMGNMLKAMQGNKPVALGNVSVEAGDQQSKPVSVEVFATAGHVHSRPESDADAAQPESGIRDSVRFNGTVSEINAMIAQCFYRPPTEHHEWDRIFMILRHDALSIGASNLKWRKEVTRVIPVRLVRPPPHPKIYWVRSGTPKLSQTLGVTDLGSFLRLPELYIKGGHLDPSWDGPVSSYQLFILAEEGAVALNSSKSDAPNEHKLILNGSIGELEKAVQQVRYRPPSRNYLLRAPLPSLPIDRIVVSLVGTGLESTKNTNETIQLTWERDHTWWTAIFSLIDRSIVVNEDESGCVGDLLNATEILKFDGNLSLSLLARHGRVWHMNDSSSNTNRLQYVSLKATSLVSLSSQLWYSPPPNFHGFDELTLKLNELDVAVAVRILPVNDPPFVRLLSSSASRDWYKHPIIFLPPLSIEDPDAKGLLTVRLTSTNASLNTADPVEFISHGVAVAHNSGVIDLTAPLDRLQRVFTSELIRVAPEPCDPLRALSCRGMINICIRDIEGATNYLTLDIPSHPMYFTLNRGQELQHDQIQVSAGGSTPLIDLFSFVEREVSNLELKLDLALSTGTLRYEDSECSEWFRLSSPDGFKARYIVIAPHLKCLDAALASTLFLADTDTSDFVRLEMTLFANETHSVLHDAITFTILHVTKPKLIDKVSVSAITASKVARVGDVLSLTSLFEVQSNMSSDDSDAGPLELLDLSVSCKSCSWSYDRLVPRVSYVLAQLPSSNLTLMTPLSAVKALIASLKFTLDIVPDTTANLATVVVTVREHDSDDMSSPSVVSIIVDEDPLQWEVKQPHLFVSRKGREQLLQDTQLTGKTSDPSTPVHLSIKCMNSSVILGIPNETGAERLELCHSDNAAIELVSSRDDINRVLNSISVGLPARSSSDFTAIELSATMPLEAIDLDYKTLVRIRWVGLKPPTVICRYKANCSVQAVAANATSLGSILIVKGNENNERYHRLLTARLTVRNGTLVLPMHVYSVEVPPGTMSSEIVISGDADALTTALEETLYTSYADFTGEDYLQILVSDYADSEEVNNDSTNVVISVLPAENEFGNSRQWYPLTPGSQVEEWPDDAVGVMGDWETISKLMPPVFPELHIFNGDTLSDKHIESGGETARYDDSESKPQLVLPLVHIEGTNEDPLPTDSWEDPTITVDVDALTSITGVSLISFDVISLDGKSTANITITMSTIHGSLTLSAATDAEMNMVDIDYAAILKTGITLSGPLDAVNKTLSYAQYRCGYECPLRDMITITTWRMNERYRHQHQRIIHVTLIEPLPIPRVILNQQVVYISEEDTLFKFDSISLDGTPSQKAMAALTSNSQSLKASSGDESENWPVDAADAWIGFSSPAAPRYILHISVSIGFIFCTVEIAGCKNENKTQSNSQTLDGPFDALLAALTLLVYRPPTNWNSEVSYGQHVVEWSFRVSDGIRANETYVDMIVAPRIDPPVIHIPSVIEDAWRFTSDHFSLLRLECLPVLIFEDLPFQFEGLSVRATDKVGKNDLALFRVHVKVQHGTLSADEDLRCVNQFATSDRLSSFTFTAGLECVNRILQVLTFTSDPHFSGEDALEIRVDRASGQPNAFDSVNIPLVVVEVNDAPYIVTSSRNVYDCEEDLGCEITDLSLVDPDILETDPLTVNIEVAYGSISFLFQDDIIIQSEPSKPNGMSITMIGSLAQLNRVMSGVIFSSAPDWNSLQSNIDGARFDVNDYYDAIVIIVSDSAVFNASTTSTFRVYVAPTPDLVVIHPPNNAKISTFDGNNVLRGDEDSELLIRDLAFSSVDETDYSSLHVSLSVQHGHLILPVLSGVSFSERKGPGIDHTVLSIFGAFANVNRSAGFIRYLPDADYAGEDTLEVKVHAVDEYTKQPTPEATIQVPIVLDAVNDAPVWVVSNPSIPAQLDTPTLISGISLKDVDVERIDCEDISCEMDVTIETSHGLVTLPKLSQPAPFSTMTDETADGSIVRRSNFLVISGTQSDLNTVLSEIIFDLQSEEYYRADNPLRSIVSVSLQVDDRGNFGKGGPQVSTTTLYIRPIAWTAHGLRLIVPEAVVEVGEDQAHIFNGSIQIQDVDAPHSHFSVLELWVSCKNGHFELRSSVRGVQLLGNEPHSIKVRGFAENLNEALNGSIYTPDLNWFGTEEIGVSVVDASGSSQRSAEAVVFLFVAQDCDSPLWRGFEPDDDPVRVREDEFLMLSSISLLTPDMEKGIEREIVVSITARNGGVLLSSVQGILIEHEIYYHDQITTEEIAVKHDSPLGDSRLFFSLLGVRGSVRDINYALSGMVYKPRPNFNSENRALWDEISFSIDPGGGASENTLSIPILVQPALDLPVLFSRNFYPMSSSVNPGDLMLDGEAAVEVFEDTPLSLGVLRIEAADEPNNSGSGRLRVTVSCWQCSVTYSGANLTSGDIILQPSLLSQVTNNAWSPQFVALGSPATLNSQLLASLVFQAASNFAGLAAVRVVIETLPENRGRYVSSGVKVERVESAVVYGLPIRVIELDDDSPMIHLPADILVQVSENSSVLLRGAQSFYPEKKNQVGPLTSSGKNIVNSNTFHTGHERGQCMSSMVGEAENYPTRSLWLSSARSDETALYSLDLTCKKGWLSLGRECVGVVFTSEYTTNSRAQRITMEGMIVDLNCAVQEVTYNSVPEQVGWDELVVGLEELAASGIPKAVKIPAVERLPIEIISINNPPVVATGARYYAPVGFWVPVGGISISDSDAANNLLYLHMTVQRGELRISQELLETNEVVVLTSAPDRLGVDSRVETEQLGSRTLELSGAVADLDVIVRHLAYACHEASGCQGGLQDYITVTVNDNGFSGEGGPQLASATATIFLQSQ